MMRKRIKVLGGVLTLGLLLGLPLVLGHFHVLAAPMSAADFFAKKTVKIIVGFGPGGGTDYVARIFASYWTEVTGGSMVVKNMPGAGGIVAANHVYLAKPDGLTLGVNDRATTFTGPVFFGQKGVRYDLRKFTYLGLIAPADHGTSLSAKSRYKTIEDLKKGKGIIFGTTGPKSNLTLGDALVIEFLGLDAKIVPGYSGSTDLGVAAGRGEIDAFSMSMGVFDKAITKGFTRPPFVTLDYKRSAWFPDTPTLPEVVNLSPEQEKLFGVFTSLANGKPVFAPPGVPADRAKFMRDAFNKMMKIKAFNRQLKLRFKVLSKPFTAEKLASEIERSLSVPAAGKAQANKLIEKYLQ